MGYYVRCFCTGSTVPTLDEVLLILKSKGLHVRCGVEMPAMLKSPEWTNCDLEYKAGNNSILVECNRSDGEESLGREECAEFIGMLLELEESPGRDKAIEHLRQAKFVIACQLPADIDDDGFIVNGEFLAYFVNFCGGMVQADGEGFYEGSTLLVEL